jgi:hypothetical protein
VLSAGPLVLGNLLRFHGLTSCSVLVLFIVTESVCFVIVQRKGDETVSGIVLTQWHRIVAVRRACLMRDRSLRLQYVFMSQSTFQRRLHPHVLELFDSEIQVLQCLRSFIRMVLEKQLGKLEAGESKLRAEPHLCADHHGLLVILASFVKSFQ